MSFEEMAERRKVGRTADRIQVRRKPAFERVMKDGEPWFVAKDVCEILDLEDPSMTVSRFDEDEKRDKLMFDTPGGPQ